jgi:5-methyltetrahydropteroyltriglutamate--homocysteine methyltransferase
MREEYQRIGEAGFLLQIDDPCLVSYYGANLGLSLAQCLEWAELRVEVLNNALRDILPEKVRYHTCYGMNIGPRVHEVSLQDGVHLLFNINAGAYSLEHDIRARHSILISCPVFGVHDTMRWKWMC